MKNKTHQILSAIETSALLSIYIAIIALLFSGCGLRQSIQDKRAENKAAWLKKKKYLTEKDSSFNRVDSFTRVETKTDSFVEVETKYIEIEVEAKLKGDSIKHGIIKSNGIVGQVEYNVVTRKFSGKFLIPQTNKTERFSKSTDTTKSRNEKSGVIKTITITKTVKVKSFNWISFGWGAFIMALLVLILALRYFLKYGNINHK